MSDTSQGPGWWLASDGKWYPPEQWTGPPNSGPLSGQAAGPSQPSMPDPTPQPGSTYPAGQPGPVGQPGAPGQPPAYGSNPWPGSATSVPPGYGVTPYGQPVYVAPGGASTNGLAIASFVCSIIGFLLITLVLAIVLGFVARSQIRNSRGQQKGDGLAIAGIIIGFAWLAFYVLLTIIGAASNNSASSVISLIGAIAHIA
jgi:hypothetical protein